ncbi:YggT family protein [Lactococcus fujiensis]|uniref:YggT family protein n=1 Tax=Lactococcus fujiensis JCM 16395 TaxID=1291764 RepID=A0A2A5RME2_9LACT|nr:YggT family protein [Lactococcus fujiensis]PCS00459.1 hypothetical protein RT41_GL001346 [Lactococcus fujiensis JCM 16395]
MMTISTLNLIANVLSFIFRLMDIYSWILVAYALMSWIPQLQSSIVGRWIIKLVRPYLNLFDRLPLQFAGLDFTVLVALISIQVIEKFIVIVFNALV